MLSCPRLVPITLWWHSLLGSTEQTTEAKSTGISSLAVISPRAWPAYEGRDYPGKASFVARTLYTAQEWFLNLEGKNTYLLSTDLLHMVVTLLDFQSSLQVLLPLLMLHFIFLLCPINLRNDSHASQVCLCLVSGQFHHPALKIKQWIYKVSEKLILKRKHLLSGKKAEQHKLIPFVKVSFCSSYFDLYPILFCYSML